MTRLLCGCFLVAAAVAVGACGGAETTVPEGDGAYAAWFSTTDPETGRTFRCQLWWRNDGYAGGLTSFCYEPQDGG